MRVVLPLVLLLAVVAMLAAQAQAPREAARPAASLRPSPRGPALEEIRGADIAAHLRFLSSDLLEGRAPSTRGGQLAAEYLAAQLATLGYAPAGDSGTYFQDVPIVESVVEPSFTLSAGAGRPFTYLEDVVAFSVNDGSTTDSTIGTSWK